MLLQGRNEIFFDYSLISLTLQSGDVLNPLPPHPVQLQHSLPCNQLRQFPAASLLFYEPRISPETSGNVSHLPNRAQADKCEHAERCFIGVKVGAEKDAAEDQDQ